jgi:outer membrane murein-binding lipoprotein Lpp
MVRAMFGNDGSSWTMLVAGTLGTLLGVAGTVLAALINRQPPMAALVDARIRVLIESYESRIGELQAEVVKLEAKVDALTKALQGAKPFRLFGTWSGSL